jgi:hypothetical protein
MEIERAVNKVLLDLKQFELINPDDEGSVRIHLTRLAVSCWEEGIRSREKILVQYTKYGIKIKEFQGIDDAVLKTEEAKRTIYQSIKDEKATRRGFIWKWKED